MNGTSDTITQMSATAETLGSAIGGARQELQPWPTAGWRRERPASRPALALARDSVYRRALVIADVVAVAGAYLIATALSSRSQALTATFLASLPVVVIGAKLTGLYDRDESLMHKTTLDEAPKLFQLATLGALTSWLAGSTLVSGVFSRDQVLFIWIALTALLLVARTCARWSAGRLVPPERCLLIGDRATANALGGRLRGERSLRAELVGQVEPASVARWCTDGSSGNRLSEIRTMAYALDVHRVIISPSWAGAEGAELLNLVHSLNAVGIRVSLLPRLLDAVGSSVEFDDVHGITVMGVRRFTLTRSSALLKRSADLLVGIFALVVLAPLMTLFAIAIKLDSPGPVFFRQRRVGLRGGHFQMFKFRTMVDGADAMKEQLRERNEAADGLFKIADDPRITRVGSLLRKTSLDELPQLLNVVRGEMSLVGPRPLVVEEDEQIEGWHRRRSELKPGMTGPWQILGPVRVPLEEMVAIDHLYVAHWSLWSDVKLLLRTVPHVLARRGI